MDIKFPFRSRLSLQNLIEYWELKIKDANPYQAEMARKILEDVNNHPELRREIEDPSLLKQHKNLIEALMSVVFPEATRDEQILVAFRPFSMEYFYGSGQFYDLIHRAGGIENMINESGKEDMSCAEIMSAYQMILSHLFEIKFPTSQSFPLRLKERDGLIKYYHLQLNPGFCEIRLQGELPRFSQDELQELVDRLSDLEFVMQKLPPELFEFTGFSIYSVTDATADEVVSTIKEILLKKDSIILDQNFDDIAEQFRSLVGQPDLRVGITAFSDGKSLFKKMGDRTCRSLLVDESGGYIEPFYNIHQKLTQTKEPYLVRDVKTDSYFRFYTDQLPNGLRSIIFCPLLIDEHMVGILEIGSNHAGSMNPITYTQIAEILPLFAVAVNRSAEELDNKIRSIIKENYTSIHPAVEWKFNEAAHKMLERKERGLPGHPEEVVFKDIYPLFAASDIRNSSLERNNAILNDLLRQLKIAREVLNEAKKIIDFPLLEELIFKISRTSTRLKKGLISGDESSVIGFIASEVEPIIRHLDQELEGFGSISSRYWSALDNEYKIVYDKRKAFEKSLTQINETISRFLDIEQEKAQAIFPHYFEKYKTDGVEYNAYIGSSISPHKRFKTFHLKNLRLWQLITTAEIARKTLLLKDKLEVPLETTHLILVHNQRLSVRFRMDEKQFDVDGAYNMRYEIMKKRIDKVHIKDTDERLTQPGKIAIVFSNEEDAVEYREYLEYLKHKGYINHLIEEYELEELQGVSGLQALRVTVEPGSSSFLHEIENLKEASLPN